MGGINMDNVSVELKGIKKKDDNNFIISFDVIVDDFDKAVEMARDIQDNLENNLKGQTVLKTGPRRKKPKSALRALIG